MRVVTGDRKKIRQGEGVECPGREGYHKGVLAKALRGERSRGDSQALFWRIIVQTIGQKLKKEEQIGEGDDAEV